MRIGPVILDERLAKGGMAEVWSAHVDDDARAGDDAIVAVGTVPRGVSLCVKRLDPAVVSDPDFVEMFRDEARLALLFEHDHVVRTYALLDDNPGGQPSELALVMAHITGASLWAVDRALRRAGTPISPSEAVAVAIQLARGLHHVHTQRDDGQALAVVHRDVSPHNVMLAADGRVVLIDFGVARAASRLVRTRAGFLKGKAAYMAPEQVRGDAVDARADQFAWGVVLWELVCGRALFHGADEARVLSRIERPEVVPPSAVVDVAADLGEAGARALDAIVLRALSLPREDRFKDMAEVAAALAQLVTNAGEHTTRLAQRTESALLDNVAAPTLAASPFAKTRVVTKERQENLAREETMPPTPSRSGLAALAALGVGLVSLLVLAAIVSQQTQTVAPATRAPLKSDDDARARARELEATLDALPPHPCRVELQGELVDVRTLTVPIVALLEHEIKDCARAVEVQPTATRRLRALAKKGLIPTKAPTDAGRPKRTTQLVERAAIALDAGDGDAAITLAEAAAALSPDDVAARRALFDAYRRAGRTSSAGVEARALVRLTGDDERRLRRWLAAHDLPE